MITREEAIRELIDQDVARWGEKERAASERQHGELSHARAVNRLGARLVLGEESGWPYDLERGRNLMKAALNLPYTPEDRALLRQGG